MSDADALLAAILANPEDDLPRLVYADWLEEHGEPERAEFIRLQCELASLATRCPSRGDVERCRREQFGPCKWCAAGEPLRRRERELLTTKNALAWGPSRAMWDAGLKAPTCTLNFMDWCPAGWVSLEFRRGFVESVFCTLAAFLEVAADLFSAQPVTPVTLTDREPSDWSGEMGATDYVWTVRTPNQIETPGDLPRELFRLLTGGTVNRDNWHRNYPTRTAALDALSAACVAYGRAEAKRVKPKLTEGAAK